MSATAERQWYHLDDPVPPVGTRVIHAEHGPGAIAADVVDLQQWLVRLDAPVPVGASTTWHMWSYPYLLRPEEQS